MPKIVVLNIKLEAIASFLTHVITSVEMECSEIERRAEAGEFVDEDDEANAFYLPMQAEEIAIRATLGELNALLESELQAIANKPYQEKRRMKQPKRPTLVYNLKWIELHHLIENYYRVQISDLPGFQEVEEMRSIVNAYKHRNGFKDPYRSGDWTEFLKRYEVERENAFRYIEAVKEFLKAMWAATNLA